MAQMGLFWCPRQPSSSSSSGGNGTRGGGGGGAAAASATRRHGGKYCCCIGRLVRKLGRRGKMLCSAGRTASFHCQYDPMSYARNFDGTGFGCSLDDADDCSHFGYTFSSRFVAPPAAAFAARPQLPAAATH